MGWSSKYQLPVFVRLIVSSATALSLANYCSAWKSFKCQLQLGLLQKVVYNSNFHLFFDNFWNGMKFHIRKPIKISKVGGLHFFSRRIYHFRVFFFGYIPSVDFSGSTHKNCFHTLFLVSRGSAFCSYILYIYIYVDETQATDSYRCTYSLLHAVQPLGRGSQTDGCKRMQKMILKCHVVQPLSRERAQTDGMQECKDWFHHVAQPSSRVDWCLNWCPTCAKTQ